LETLSSNFGLVSGDPAELKDLLSISIFIGSVVGTTIAGKISTSGINSEFQGRNLSKFSLAGSTSTETSFGISLI
jgi:hypothetical protein